VAGWRFPGSYVAVLTQGKDHGKPRTWCIPKRAAEKAEPDPYPWNPSRQVTPRNWAGAKGGSLLHVMQCEEAPGGWRQALNSGRQRKHGSH